MTACPPASRAALWAALAYSALIYVTLPAEAIAINDDFAYLKSVVQTVQHGRPWTNDWLEPWAASLSGMCAVVFRLTGSFHVAIAGVQAVLAGVSLWALAKLFAARGCSEAKAAGVAALALMFPTVLWKSLEFTGMTLHLPCLLLALLAAERRRWDWFTVVWLLAIGNRQSALAWAALPALAGWEQAREPRGFWRNGAWRPTVAALLGVGVWLLVARAMNKTASQATITDHVFAQATWRGGLPGVAVGVAVFFLSAGVGALVLRAGAAKPEELRSQNRFAVGALVLLGVAFLGYDGRIHLAREHACFDGAGGWFYTKLLTGLAFAGWLGGGFALRGKALLYAAGSLVLVGLRSEVWDYYLIDIAVFGLFAVALRGAERASTAATPADSTDARWRGLLRTGVVIVAAFHLFFLVHFKFRLDRGLAFCSVTERALRQGQLSPVDLSFPPFGFIAWHLHPYYVAHEGRLSADIASFDIYQRRDVAAVHSRYGGWLRVLPVFRDEPFIDPAMLLVHERRRVGWFFPADYWLVKLPPEKITPARVPIDFSDYRTVPFPLNDKEWSALAAGPRL